MLPGRVNEDAVTVGSTGGVVFVCFPLVVSTPEPDLHSLNDGGVPDESNGAEGDLHDTPHAPQVRAGLTLARPEGGVHTGRPS